MKTQLEQVLCQPKQSLQVRTTSIYRTNNLEKLSAFSLYTRSGEPMISPTRSGFVIPYGNLDLFDLGIKDVHDTYKIDKDGNVSGGHTTYTNISNIKKRVNNG